MREDIRASVRSPGADLAGQSSTSRILASGDILLPFELRDAEDAEVSSVDAAALMRSLREDRRIEVCYCSVPDRWRPRSRAALGRAP